LEGPQKDNLTIKGVANLFAEDEKVMSGKKYKMSNMIYLYLKSDRSLESTEFCSLTNISEDAVDEQYTGLCGD